MASVFDATEIGINVRLSAQDAATRTVDLAIRIDPADLAWTQDTARLALTVAGYRKGVRTEMFPAEELTPKRTPQAIPAEQRLTLAPGVDTLRVLVYDRESGALGSLTLPLSRK